MSRSGWYPDPGGAPGMYRYWDGVKWSTALTANPATAPIPPDAAQGQQFGGPAYSGGQPLIARPPQPNPYAGASGFSGRGPAPARGGRRGFGWWLLILVLVAGLVFGGYSLLRSTGFTPGNPAAPSNPTPDPCPPRDPANETIAPQVTADGRVQGGKLSYPLLPDPWSLPSIETRVPFGRGAATQIVSTEPNYDGQGNSWVASVLVAELVAGDGFFSPQAGTDLVAKCAMGTFYGDAVVTRDDRVNKAVTVDGKDGWLLETHLSFNIPGLKEKGETAIFEIVATEADSWSLFYASIPDSRPDLLDDARQVQSELRVEP